MKKIKLIIISFFLIIFYISCSNNQSTFIYYVEEDTLKINIKQKGEDTIWTKEIEGNLLSENIKKNSHVLNTSLTPTVMNIISNKKDPIYPYFENFVELDDRNIPLDLRAFLEKFCDSISTDIYAADNSFFTEDFLFSYVFFVNDLIEGWKINFKTDFPIIKSVENKNDNIDEETSKKRKEKNKILNNWIFGQPFISEDYLQIPVRLYSVNGFIDVVVLLNNNTPYEICNIEIKNWEKKYGK